jgi:hypothetical protein
VLKVQSYQIHRPPDALAQLWPRQPHPSRPVGHVVPYVLLKDLVFWSLEDQADRAAYLP